jgi:hydroxymethylbilane synthase
MTQNSTLRLGTRRSALAWVQSSQVAAALEQAHPGLKIELVGIETRGDRVLDKPLSAIEGKEFFTAEIDAALSEQRVDFTVHSLKDLSLDRPAEFILAAVPRRANPRDIALFCADAPELLAQGKVLRIGTSSPRRAQLLPAFFAQALPFGNSKSITLENLRGNVDSRLRRLKEPRGSERQLDGVVLATAGLARLFADTQTERQGQALLKELLQGVHIMMLPLAACPGAPGQGALAIECRAGDQNTRQILASLEHQETRGAITLERELLRKHGGGCHQRFGASLQWLPQLGGLMHVAGCDSHGSDITARQYLPNTALPEHVRPPRSWDGTEAPRAAQLPLLDAAGLGAALRGKASFVAHSRALPAGAAPLLKDRAVWTSGIQSWFALAKQGIWVQGCGEALGAGAAADLIMEPLLQLPPLAQWDVLTHRAAADPWQSGAWAGANVVATYEIGPSALGADDALAQATHVFWSSTAQFEQGQSRVSTNAYHASGAGKTAEHIRKSGVRNFLAFPSVSEWREWTAKAR